MKKLLLLTLLTLFIGCALAADFDMGLVSYKSAFEIKNKNSQEMTLNFSLPDYEVLEEIQGGNTYHRILMPDSGTLMESGLPELPTISTSIAIPPTGRVNIQVQDSEYSILNLFNAYPLQQGQELDSPKGFVRNAAFYGAGSLYPSAQIEYSDPMILRELRIVTIQVNPFVYDPSTQQLRVYNNMQIKVNFTDEPGVNELSAPVTYVSKSFETIYDSFIQNFDDYRDLMFAGTPPRYLLIYGNTTDATFLNALNAYVLWKRQKGADVDIATTAANSAGTSTSSIQTYIRTRYNNTATRPDFVVLIGDTSGSFTIPCFTNNGGSTDYPYSFMNTGDMLGDVFIGRISVENSSQFLVILNKIFLYERDINVDTAGWLNHSLLVGDTSPSGISCQYINKYIKEMLMEVNPNATFTEQYGPEFGNFSGAINNAFNQGIAFYSFRGYIDYVPPPEGSINNGYKLPHTVTITCGSGNFNGLAESEQIIRYGTVAAPKGAVTGIGMATSSTHTTFNNVIHGGIFHGAISTGMRTMGEALLHGRLYTWQIFGVSSPLNAERFTHWCNLMGDPTMEVFVKPPEVFQMTSEDIIPVGLSLLDVVVNDASWMPVAEASVTLSQGQNILSRGYTREDGTVVLVLPEVMNAGDAVITVSMHNYKPLQKTITIVDMDTLVPAAIIIDDDNTGASSGNNNGIATAGETLEIFFGLKNTGSEPVSGVTGIATSNTEWVEILQDQISYPQILGGATGNNFSPIVLKVGPNAPHHGLMRLHLILTDDQGNNYDISEFIEVEAAKVNFISLEVVDDHNGKLDPNESAAINVSVVNNGAAVVSNVYARLYTMNDLLSVQDNTAYFGTLGIGTIAYTTDNNFSVWLRPETLPGMVIPLYMKLYNEDGFEQIVHFTLTVGTVTSTDPLGPDTYGYVIYDWTDTAYPECPQYSWFEIAPPAGGLGTPLTINDPYTSTEGDQVGATSLAVVNLPFPFQFYGRLYGQITVCSNGFIALGVSENAEFRNFRLPGAMGPSPMIAPFWDDLATHSGSGIYTYFDRNNHAFIVEWYNLKNGYNNSSPETFQVILYDQTAYPTSLGDGPIKFQYHTFNNVDVQSGNKHGNYSTIGIEDHTGTRGLEYTFNNTYPTAAAPLSNGKALYITNVPIYYETANIAIDETYVNGGERPVEPGESVNLGVMLINNGNVPATDVSAVLSCHDPYVTIIHGESNYYDLEPEIAGVNRTPFVFSVAEDCPSEHNVSFDLDVISEERVWTRSFTVRVEANNLQYHSFMMSDFDGNFDGIIDPNENVQLIVNIKNNSQVDAHNVVVNLSTDQSSLNIGNPQISIPSIPAHKIMQAVFDLDFTDINLEPGYISMFASAVPESGPAMDVNFYIPYNQSSLSNDFELDNGGFTTEAGWSWGIPIYVPPLTGEKVWGTSLQEEYMNNMIYNLYTPKYTLSQSSTLSFKHYYDTESQYDGANVCISTNGGQSWQLLSPNEGYNTPSITVLSGQPGWSGNSQAWITASFDLSQYSEQEVIFRFRMGTNGDVVSYGWFIDNFELTGVNLKTGHLQGIVTSSSDANPSQGLVYSNQNYIGSVKNNGNFRLYLPNGTHSVTATMPNHQSSTLNNVQISIANPTHTTEFVLIDMPTVDNLSFMVDNDTGQFLMMWVEPSGTLFNITGYRIYRRFDSGPFELAAYTEDFSYGEVFELEGIYQFYISPIYMDYYEGGASNILNVRFPYEANEDSQSPALTTGLKQNYPNPFNPTTTIAFSLANASRARLNIYNTKGQLVRKLANTDYPAGEHHLVWDGKDKSGKSVASGIYFYRLETGSYSKSRKMILMK